VNLNFENVSRLCSCVSLEPDTPIIDLSNITFFRPYALVYLGMFLRYHNINGKSFRVLVPTNSVARNYLAQQNFWERFNFNPESVTTERLRRFASSTSLNDIVDVEKRYGIAEDIAGQIMEVIIRNNVNVKAGLVTELVCELVDNFAIHSKCSLAAVAMQYYPNLSRVVFAVGDCGIGIRASLTSNPDYAHLAELPHWEVALKAFEPLVSRLRSGGTGLTEVRDELMNLNGRLILSTGDGYVIIAKGEATYGQLPYHLAGVQMEMSIPEGE